MEERGALKACISDPMLKHVPVLVVCNKMDLDGAHKVEEVSIRCRKGEGYGQ